MNIIIRTIPHSKQRYETVGDWQYDEVTDTLNIRVSDMGNWRYEAMVGIHEAIEAILCRDKSVSEKDVDEFDMNFDGEGEPGNDPSAPYFSQHQAATTVEKLMCNFMDLNWDHYDKTVEEL